MYSCFGFCGVTSSTPLLYKLRSDKRFYFVFIIFIWLLIGMPVFAADEGHSGVLQFIYNGFGFLFGNSMAQETSKFIQVVLDGVSGALITNGELSFKDPSGADALNTAFSVFQGAAGSILIIYFFMHLIDQSSKDMFTSDRLVLSCIQLLIGCAIIIYLPEIIVGCLQIIDGVYGAIAGGPDELAKNLGGNNSKIQIFGLSPDQLSDHNYNDPEVKGFDTEFYKGGPFRNIAQNIGVVFILFIPFAISLIARLAAYFLVISNALILIARVVMCPLAVAQCFDGGTRSNGIRYIKKLISTGLIFAIIILMLYASQSLTNSVLVATLKDMAQTDDSLKNLVHGGVINITAEVARDIIKKPRILLATTAIQVAAVGGMFTGAKIANDVVGE